VSAVHKSASHVDRRTAPLRQAQRSRAHRRADDVHNGIHRADFMKVHLLRRDAMYLALGLSQQFEGAQRDLLRGIADRRPRNQCANLRPAAAVDVAVTMFMRVFMRMRVLVFLRPMLVRVGMAMRMPVRLVFVLMIVIMSMTVFMAGLVRVVVVMRLFGRMAMLQHICFGRANAAAVHDPDTQFRSDPQSGRRLLQQLQRDARIDQGTQHHVAGNPGEALQLCNGHIDLQETREPGLALPASISAGSSSFIEPER
jgi:uncharacterized membrane protein YuzA (DUF378 family)